MEHIIQFGVTIDDDAIRKNVESKALDAVVAQIVNEMKSNMPKDNYGYGKKIDWYRVSGDAISKFIEDNKDEILKIMSNELVERVCRSKAYREARDRGLGVSND